MSDCRNRDVQIFCPLMTYPPATFLTKVLMRSVLEPASGSVTPNACRRSAPLAIFGRMACFCASLPCCITLAIVYICAWQTAALPPFRFISSMITQAFIKPRPAPPYWSGINAASQPAPAIAST